tara:strand:+ start:794 stop:1132 length:339 start_codon:yes stop_codon:yes gene_type:complete
MMTKGIILFILANILGWFNIHLQFMHKWWAERPVTTILIFSFPVGYLFLMGTKYIVGSTGVYWSSRLIGFSIATTIYAILTWVILKESFFEIKTLTCLSLCCVVLIIQVFWK